MILVKDILVEYPQSMTETEATAYADEEIELWAKRGKKLDKVIIEIEGNEAIVRGFEQSPIKRVRRITGYLSEAANFNDAKRAELKARTVHVSNF
ncbi:MAG: anaerobic ribonucleoside-triphosphate reductase [Negativicutes bacterium]|nr:anaerobic ribonucleoside-triphosphate reductase [Negativicutes bacterium]